MARGKNTPEQTVSLLRFAHWWALTHYVNDELLEIDNSAAERALRAVALERKNNFSVDPAPAANERPRSTPWSAQPN